MSTPSDQKEVWTDPRTGLMWQALSPGQMSWYDAVKYAAALYLGGYRDWRFPSIKELESLLDRRRYRPTMREEIPFRDERSYWSSTTFGPDTQNAWIIMFDGAYVLSYYKTNAYHVRCVRGGNPGNDGRPRSVDIPLRSTREE